MTHPTKPAFESKNIPSANISDLAQLFPSCITESREEDGKLKQTVDFEKLRALLGSDIAQGDESYDFTWVGKKAAMQEAGIPVRKTLRPCTEESRDWDTTQNLYIEGDNLDVLKLLQESYLKKVKMIYIDPPYNTGNDFIYNDHFETDKDEYDEGTGAVDDSGIKNFQQNNDANPRFHSDWCSMIYPRLVLARNLLTDDGVIFISIDDNEQSNLKKICDEIFGSSNFVSSLIWAAGRKNDSKYISVSHEYILCYSKSLDYLIENKIIWKERKQGIDEIYNEVDLLKKKFHNDYRNMQEELRNWYKGLPVNDPALNHKHYNCIDEKGVFFPADISWPGGGGPKYEVVHPVTNKPVKIPNRGWVYPSQARMKEMIDIGKIYFGEDETSVPCIKTYLKENEFSAPYSVFYKDGRSSTKRLRLLLEGNYFENPKDEEIISSLIEFTLSNSDSIILDFFSGSATTAHAVMQLNAEDGGNRKFIMVQLPEKCVENSEAYKAGYKTICDIGKERIRRAGDKIKTEMKSNAEEKKQNAESMKNDAQLTLDSSDKESVNSAPCIPNSELDIGFRVFKVDDSNMKDVYYSAEETSQKMLAGLESNIKEDRTDMDLLYGCLLDWGLPLSLPHTSETIDGVTVHTVNNGDLIACFNADIPESAIRTIAQRKPLRAVFRDSSFATSPEKINVTEIFKTISPTTGVKVI